MSNNPFAGFGTPKDNVGSYENFRLSPDEPPLILGILPPMKDCAADGIWSLYFGLHFGYKVPSQKDPDKTYNRPFLCMEEREWNNGAPTTTFQDAVDEIIRAKEKEKEAIRARLISSGVDERKVYDDEYQRVSKWLYNHSVDRKHRLLVVDQTGRFGILKITNTCMKALKEVKEKLAQKDKTMIPDVTNGAKGVWISFSRSGKGRDTKDTVEAFTKTKNVEGIGDVEVMQEFELTPEMATQALKVLPDLKAHRDSYSIGAEVIEQLAALGEAPDPKKVAEIMPKRETSPSSTGNEPKSAQVTPTQAAQSAPKLSRGDAESVLPPPAATAVAAPDEDIDAQIAALMALMAKKASQAKVEEKVAAPAATNTEAPAAAPADVEDDEDFEAIFGG